MQSRYSYSLIQKSTEPLVYLCNWDTVEDVPAGYRCGPVVRDLFVIECNVFGYGRLEINGKNFNIEPRTCCVLFPGDTVLIESDKDDPKLALWCIFGGTKVGDILERAGITSENPFIDKEKFNDIYAIMQKIYAASSNIDMGDELLRTAGLYELLGTITKGVFIQEKNPNVEYAIKIIEEQFEKPINVSDIAQQLGFSRSYFTTLFTKVTGLSPYSYLNSVRVRRACELLTSTELSINDVSEQVGIAANNFSRIFKSEMGISPTAFKKKSQN